MVNRGHSQGCITCKQRRVKCDEAKPSCRACQRLGLQCGGYRARTAGLKFKDQTHKFASEADSLKIRVRKHGAVPVPRPRQLKDPDTAVPFFLGHYANIGRRIESARGFFEVLIPVYFSQAPSSALSLAVSALASEVLNLWCYGPRRLPLSPETYIQAIAGLRRVIQDPVEQTKPATALAVMTLQRYENVAAICGLRPATCTHHNGAVSLLPFIIPDNMDKTTPMYTRKSILHAEISSAMRQKRPLKATVQSWISNENGGLLDAPNHPSSTLDAIGARVAELQARYVHSTSTSLENSQNFAIEAKAIDQQLQAWSRSVPQHWQPVRLTSDRTFRLSIPAYKGVCDIYPSCQIGTIWNTWRVNRLVVISIILDASPTEPSIYLDGYRQSFQELVDSICYTVPFYLGNRSKPVFITDFTDSSIIFCDQGHQESKEQSLGLSTTTLTIKDEQRRHMIAQGPWHAMSPLSRLLTLFAGYRGLPLTSLLRPGQHQWIREQFLRVTQLLHLSIPAPHSSARCRDLNSPVQMDVFTGADALASLVRRGAMFMGGP